MFQKIKYEARCRFSNVINNIGGGAEWPSGLSRHFRLTPAMVRCRPWVAFFFEQVTVSGKKCRHPPPGHGKYTYRRPLKNLPNQNTRV